jgi:hypothetical protein
VQLYPIKVQGRTDDYFIMNALRRIDCIDWAQSKTLPSLTRDERLVLIKAVIDLSRISHERIFKLAKGYLVVNREVKDAIEAAGLTGARFERQRTIATE